MRSSSVASAEDDDRYFCNVTLHRGWGIRVLVESADFKPIRNARVLVDGQPAGRTEAAGYVDLNLDQAPASIEATYLAWKPKHGFPAVASQLIQRGAWFRIFLQQP